MVEALQTSLTRRESEISRPGGRARSRSSSLLGILSGMDELEAKVDLVVILPVQA
jgi:hypothetical protein